MGQGFCGSKTLSVFFRCLLHTCTQKWDKDEDFFLKQDDIEPMFKHMAPQV